MYYFLANRITPDKRAKTENTFSVVCAVVELICGRDSDGLALGVVELVHSANVHDHGDAPGEDESQEEGYEESGPDGGREVFYGVHGCGERLGVGV